ncbi:MAG TPA: GNAT family N-acetyltransferase [Planctomycetota bacterium]|nr:GNAT family N-acetyltransferase [Planctomycetota bacterium]
MKNSPAKSLTEKARTKKTAAPEHDHGDGVCCNHEHGPCCDFELGIRPYRTEDYRDLKAVWKAGEIATDDTSSARALKENLEKRQGSFQVFVAEVVAIDAKSGKPAGARQLAGGVIVTYDGHRAYIYHFAVHPDFRGVGLGAALLETCEHQARLWGAKHLRLMSRTDAARDGARKLYEKHGWARDWNLCQYKKDL